MVALLVDSRTSTLSIDSSRITLAQVQDGQFIEYIPILGTVEPIKTVFLDAVEGGQVQEIFVDKIHAISNCLKDSKWATSSSPRVTTRSAVPKNWSSRNR